MSDNYRKDSKEYCRREEKSKPTSGAYIRASTFALQERLAIKGCPDGRDGVNGKDMRFASFIDGRVGSAGCQAAQTCCV